MGLIQSDEVFKDKTNMLSFWLFCCENLIRYMDWKTTVYPREGIYQEKENPSHNELISRYLSARLLTK